MSNEIQIKPIAYIRTALPEKFGVPRQSGLVDGFTGRLELLPEYKDANILRGLSGFSHIWLIWGFSENTGWSATVRPPRLGGNERVGVFASRSPFRPNPLGLSSVKIIDIDESAGIITFSGADMVDNTPVYDIKPYLPYTDSHPEALSGFAKTDKDGDLTVSFSCENPFSKEETDALKGLISQDPRPQYQDDERIYRMTFNNYNIGFFIKDGTATITEIIMLDR